MKPLRLVFLLALSVFAFASTARAQTHFTNCSSRTFDNATIIIPATSKPAIAGVPLENGDEIAVLTPGGACAGVSVWAGTGTVLTAWGLDDLSQLAGFRAGDTLRYAIWDASARVEYQTVEAAYATSSSFLRVDGVYAGGAIYELASLNAAVPSSAPVLASPANGGTGVQVSATLAWQASSGATSYDLQISTTADFSVVALSKTGITGTSFTASGLAAGTTYHWRVRAVNMTGAGSYSGAWSFTTAAQSTPAMAEHTIALQPGWNLISSYVVPSLADLDAVFQPLAGRMVMVKDSDGRVYWPEYNIKETGTWFPVRAYKVYMSAAGTLTLSGRMVMPQSTPISLQQGWNTVSYLRNTAMPVEQAVASLGAHLVFVKDNAGNVYMPELGINNIGMLQPGQGYKVYVRQAATLTYPANGADAASKTDQLAGTQHEAEPGVSSSAHLIVRAPQWQDGTQLTVWSGGRQVGSGTIAENRGLLLVRGDDPLTEDVVEGAAPGALLTLRREGASGSIELRAGAVRDVLANSEQGGLTYQPDAVLEVALNAASVDAGLDVPQAFSLEQNYPNPFNPSTTIRYAIEEDAHVTLEVFNMLGQRVRLLVSEPQRAGQHDVAFDAYDLPSGQYMYRLNAGNRVEVKTMTLLK